MHLIIIGSTRCGTTSLYNYLSSHPAVRPAKGTPFREVHFFDYPANYAQGHAWYDAQFPSAPVTVDTSPTMLQHPLCPDRVTAHSTHTKLVVLLRDPADRAYSDYWLAVRKGWIKEPFESAIKREPARLKRDLVRGRFWKKHFFKSHHHLRGFLERGLYKKHLVCWGDCPNDLLVVRSEDLFKKPQRVADEVFAFVGLEPKKIIARVWHKGNYPPMRKETRKHLDEYFERQNDGLKDVLKRIRWRQ